MKQTFNEALKGLFREATTYQTKDVLTCCRTVVHQYCRTELFVQTVKSPMIQAFESSMKLPAASRRGISEESLFNSLQAAGN